MQHQEYWVLQPAFWLVKQGHASPSQSVWFHSTILGHVHFVCTALSVEGPTVRGFLFSSRCGSNWAWVSFNAIWSVDGWYMSMWADGWDRGSGWNWERMVSWMLRICFRTRVVTSVFTSLWRDRDDLKNPPVSSNKNVPPKHTMKRRKVRFCMSSYCCFYIPCRQQPIWRN